MNAFIQKTAGQRWMMKTWLRLAALIALVAGIGAAQAQDSAAVHYSVETISERLDQPTGFAHAQDELLYITERDGTIRILEDGALRGKPFLDIVELVSSGASPEQGLLGLAFDPDYARNGYFYVTYTDAEYRVHLARYQVSAYRYAAVPGSRQTLLTVPHAIALHKGGHLRFGPDGYLYMSVGDGGLSDNPQTTGQNPQDLLGKILRLDVRAAPPYQIPPDNPFVGDARYRPEIWLMGFRNPWQFNFAPDSPAMYITDVGWSSWEEINYLPAVGAAGLNYGWRVFEGEQRVEGGDAPLPGVDYQPPVFAYPHLKPLGYDGSMPIGCAIIGGLVYRGASLPELRGRYIFGDYCNGELWTLRRDGAGWTVEKLYETAVNITALGEDASGEFYFASRDGKLRKLIHAPASDSDDDGLPNDSDNCPNRANPDQGDNWGAVGVGDACDTDFYFSKREQTEVKMFQQHYGAYHFYACQGAACGFVAAVEPAALSQQAPLQLHSEGFGWTLQAVYADSSNGKAIYQVSIFDEAGVYYVDDLQLLVAGNALSWRAGR